jgi:phenylacetate-CoA ligase
MTATTANPAETLQALAAEQLARDAWSRERLLAYQSERLCQLLAHVVVRSPFYLETLGPEAAGRPLHELPTLTKATLMDQWDRIVCDPRLRRADVEAHAAGDRAEEPYLGEFSVFSTSGASGLRGLLVYSAAEWMVALAVSMRAMIAAGARPGERTVGIGAPPGPHMSERIYAALRTRGDTPRISALTPLDEMVAALNAYQPEILLGYPTVGAMLAAEQLAGRLRIAPRMIAFGSEPLTAETRERVQEAWGLDPNEYYSTSEAPVIASSTPAHPRALEIFEDQYLIEIVDEDNRPVPPGTAGAKVLVTNLENRTLPLIRYELADRVMLSPEPNPAGRPYRHIAAIDGRTGDILTFPARGGGEVQVLPLRLGGPFARLPAVRQFQIVHAAGALEIRVVLEPGAPEDTRDRVRAGVVAALDEAGAVAPAIDVVAVDQLEREPGGGAKLKLIVARVP